MYIGLTASDELSAAAAVYVRDGTAAAVVVAAAAAADAAADAGQLIGSFGSVHMIAHVLVAAVQQWQRHCGGRIFRRSLQCLIALGLRVSVR